MHVYFYSIFSFYLALNQVNILVFGVSVWSTSTFRQDCLFFQGTSMNYPCLIIKIIQMTGAT